MRAGIIVSGATALAAIATAALIQIDAFGRPGPAATKSASARPAPPRPAEPAAPAVRQIAQASPAAAPAPAPPPATPITPTPVTTIAIPVAAAPAAPPAQPAPQRPLETTGSIAPKPALYVNGTRVALRSGPDAKATALQRMEKGQRLVEMARSGDWVRVRLAPGEAEGWVSATLLTTERPN